MRPALAELARGLQLQGGGRASLVVRLDGADGAAVLVRLTVRPGAAGGAQVDVSLRTADAVAVGTLTAASHDVRALLSGQGLDLASFDVAHGDTSPHGRGSDERKEPREAAPDRATPGGITTADGAVRVTDDAPSRPGTWL